MMKLARTSGLLCLLSLALVASPPALAQAPGWYGGFGVGPSRSDIDDARISGAVLGGGVTATTTDKDNRDTGYKLYGGYQFHRFFALEGGYFDLGRFDYTATTSPAGTLQGDMRFRGLNLDAVGRLPLTEKLTALGRVGLTYVDTSDRFQGSGAAVVADPHPGKREDAYKYGVGLEYELTQAVALRLEAERYRINDGVGNRGNVNLVTAGLVFRFGGKSQDTAPAAAAPVAMVAQAEPTPAPAPVVVPPPAPAPAPAPAPRLLKREVIAVDNDFDFDKVSLNPAGKRTMDRFVSDLKGLNYERITVIGNTDRLGTESYNMKLSQRRADAVRNYLLQSGSIPASKIVATGAGESDHRTVPSDCVGTRATARLIECLQPDRRVDIEVHGSR
jgi:OOP family OmpA-OmpF porin